MAKGKKIAEGGQYGGNDYVLALGVRIHKREEDLEVPRFWIEPVHRKRR